MKRQWLHDAAKFAAGLVTADFFMHAWLASENVMPQSVLGIPVDPAMIVPGMVLDFFLFILLVHYGWNIGKIPRIKETAYLTIAGTIFMVVAFVHLTRIFYSTDIVVMGWSVPFFLSWIGVFVATYMAYASFHFAARAK